MIALFVSVDLGGPVYCLSLEGASLCGRVPLQSLVPLALVGSQVSMGSVFSWGALVGSTVVGGGAGAGETKGGT